MKHIPDDELALYAGNDLDATPHLNECAECRGKLEEFRAAGGWLKRMAAEPSEEQLEALRHNVLRAVSRRKRMPWPYAAAAAAAVAIAVLLVSRHTVIQPAPNSVTAVAQTPTRSLALIDLGPLTQRPHRRVKGHAPAMTLLANHGPDPVIKLRTSDPHVVVLWVMNTNSEEENRND